MKRFRYLLDPLCVGCCTLYALNRWGIKPHIHSAFFRFWFNDLLLIPCALPPALQFHRWMNWRRDDRWPSVIEVVSHLILWSALFEFVGPFIMSGVTGDWRDVAAYLAGGIGALFYWNIAQVRRDSTT